jgi:hypothetical protein
MNLVLSLEEPKLKVSEKMVLGRALVPKLTEVT